MRALSLQGFNLHSAIGLVDERAAYLMALDPEAFVNPPPWPGIYT